MTINKAKETIGQLEKSIDNVEEHLGDEEFQDYCDSIYSGIAHLRCIIKKLKQEENDNN